MSFTKFRPVLFYGLRSKQILLNNRGSINMLTKLPSSDHNHCRTYKNFGHRRDPPEHPLKKCYMLVFIGLMFYQFIDWDQ